MKRYSIVSMDKWTRKTKVLFSTNDFHVVKAKYSLVLKYLKYMQKLSPNKSVHRVANLRIFLKIYKELHTAAIIYPFDLLQPNLVVLRDNETNLIISPIRFHRLVGGLIPNEITPEYLAEKEEVKNILNSLWQDYNRIYNFKYFKL